MLFGCWSVFPLLTRLAAAFFLVMPSHLIVQATVSVIPAASSLILKALNEPARDRKKVCARVRVPACVRTMLPRYSSRCLAVTVTTTAHTHKVFFLGIGNVAKR